MTKNAEPFERTSESWEPFMRGLSLRFRREKRSRNLRRAAALALGLGALVGLGAGFGLMEPRRNAAPLMAMVPTADAPVFEPDSGLVRTLPGGAIAINSGGRS